MSSDATTKPDLTYSDYAKAAAEVVLRVVQSQGRITGGMRNRKLEFFGGYMNNVTREVTSPQDHIVSALAANFEHWFGPLPERARRSDPTPAPSENER